MNAKQKDAAAYTALESAKKTWGRGWTRLGMEARQNAIAYKVLYEAAVLGPSMSVGEVFEIFKIANGADEVDQAQGL